VIRAREAYSTRERAKLLLSNLEKLKAEVSAIEARHDILKTNYSQLCEEAISKISAVMADLERDPKSKLEESEVFTPDIGTLEARFKLGLVPMETYLRQMGVLTEDITPTTEKLQSIIDKVADGIEFGLDKMGAGIIFPIKKIVNLCNAIPNIANRKAKKRHYT